MVSQNKHEICVIYLARAADGTTGLKRFVDSYIACPGEIDHDLWIAFKGFGSDRAIAEYMGSAAPVTFNEIHVPDHGFDIGTYGYVARRLGGRYRYFCFLNTHSELLDENWLRHLHHWAAMEHVGAVAATGSYESIYSGMPKKGPKHRRLVRRVLAPMVRPFKLWRLKVNYPPFPNPHLRTNAMMLKWEIMRQVWPRHIRTKETAFRFESGVNSLTNQVRRMGLKVLVVGRDGRGYDIDDWPSSNTFRIGRHQNLLVADNRSRGFETMSREEKLFLARCAWGDRMSADSI